MKLKEDGARSLSVVGELEAKLAGAQKQRELDSETIALMTADVQAVAAELERRNSALRDLQVLNSQLQDQNERQSKKVGELTLLTTQAEQQLPELAELRAEVAHRATAETALNDRVAELQVELHLKEEREIHQDEELQAAVTRQAVLTGELEQKNSEVEQLRRNIAEVAEELCLKQEESEADREHIVKLSIEVEATKHELEDTVSKLREAQNALTEARAELATGGLLSQEIDDLKL